MGLNTKSSWPPSPSFLFSEHRQAQDYLGTGSVGQDTHAINLAYANKSTADHHIPYQVASCPSNSHRGQ